MYALMFWLQKHKVIYIYIYIYITGTHILVYWLVQVAARSNA